MFKGQGANTALAGEHWPHVSFPFLFHLGKMV